MFGRKKKDVQMQAVQITDELFEELMQGIISHKEDSEPIAQPRSIITAISQADAFIKDYHNNPDVFQPGDLIVWKEGMKNRERPAYDEAAVVLEVFDEVLRDTSDLGSSLGGEPLRATVILSYADSLEQAGVCPFLTYPIDTHRFKLVKKK